MSILWYFQNSNDSVHKKKAELTQELLVYREENIELIDAEDVDLEDEGQRKEISVVITDDPNMGDRIRAWTDSTGSCCVIGIDPSLSAYFYGASYVLEDLEELDITLLLKVHRRMRGDHVWISKGDKISLRELQSTDYSVVNQLTKDNSVWNDDASQAVLQSKEGFLAYVQNQYDWFGYGIWAVIENAANQIIGLCGFDVTDNGYELGYLIAPAYRRRGYAEQACQLAIEYLKQDLIRQEMDPPQITASIRKNNEASIRLARKLSGELFREDDKYVFFHLGGR